MKQLIVYLYIILLGLGYFRALSLCFSSLVLELPEFLDVFFLLLQVVVKMDDNTPPCCLYYIFILLYETVWLVDTRHKYFVLFSVIRVYDYFLDFA